MWLKCNVYFFELWWVGCEPLCGSHKVNQGMTFFERKFVPIDIVSNYRTTHDKRFMFFKNI